MSEPFLGNQLYLNVQSGCVFKPHDVSCMCFFFLKVIFQRDIRCAFVIFF